MSYTYEWPRPSVTVDCVVFGLDEETLKVLLIERDVEPFAGTWALPGGFVRMDEDLEDAAKRELEEEAGVALDYLEQLQTVGTVGRDPRGRVITVAYVGLVRRIAHEPRAATDARSAAWFPVTGVPQLAFDHEEILLAARERLRTKVRYRPIGVELLPKKFTLGQMQRMYEVILERPLDKRNFRKKIASFGLLIALDEKETGVAHRAARLYRFDRRKYRSLEKKGFDFEI